MLKFYIYAYLRSKDSKTAKAGTPYYIGKGTGNRAWSKYNHGNKTPKNKDHIIILESGLTNIGALALERRLIKWWGRVDNNTGILRNLTDGGEGSNGKVMSDDTKRKLREAFLGKPAPKSKYEKSSSYVSGMSGKKLTLAQRLKHSKNNTGEGNPRAKLNEQKVLEILKLLKDPNNLTNDIADKYNISYATVIAIKNRRLWKHIDIT
jgi:hypothetical protein